MRISSFGWALVMFSVAVVIAAIMHGDNKAAVPDSAISTMVMIVMACVYDNKQDLIEMKTDAKRKD
jgi:hypothetical protein